jgi:hypothetical protein
MGALKPAVDVAVLLLSACGRAGEPPPLDLER